MARHAPHGGSFLYASSISTGTWSDGFSRPRTCLSIRQRLEPVGGLRREQMVVDADAIVLLPGACLIIPESVNAGLVRRELAHRFGKAQIEQRTESGAGFWQEQGIVYPGFRPLGIERRWESHCNRLPAPWAPQARGASWRGRQAGPSRRVCSHICPYPEDCRWADKWRLPVRRSRHGNHRLDIARMTIAIVAGQALDHILGFCSSKEWQRHYRSSAHGRRHCSPVPRRLRPGRPSPRI